VGRFKSRKSESLGFAEAVAFERELLAEVAETGEFLVVLMVAVEIGDNPPVVEGDGLGAKVFVGPLATSLDGAEKPSGSGGDGERSCRRGVAKISLIYSCSSGPNLPVMPAAFV